MTTNQERERDDHVVPSVFAASREEDYGSLSNEDFVSYESDLSNDPHPAIVYDSEGRPYREVHGEPEVGSTACGCFCTA